MIGLKKGYVALEEHHRVWITYAQDMINKLSKLSLPTAIIEHIGSTSISSIKAKPIIDLAIGVTSFEEVEKVMDDFSSLGFIYNPKVGNKTWMYFNKSNDENLSTFHLHVLLKNSQAFKNHLYFRDFLINHEDYAKDYELLKIALAKAYPTDREMYTKKKEHMIKIIIRKAQVSHFLGKEVTIVIDRPIGAIHPKHPNITYPINYGFIPGEIAPDDEELDVYLLDVELPVKTYTGKIIAIIHRENDCEDKLVMSNTNKRYTKEEIKHIVYFQEQFYHSKIELSF